VAGLLERTGPNEVTVLNGPSNDRAGLVQQGEVQAVGPRYAVILLTADDVGAPRLDSDQEPYYSPRARQGVVFEMGFLVATFGPRCVCVLYEDGVELPCDLDGIGYIRLDLAGTWQSKLLLKLRSAGFDYDVNMLAPV
jgi:predicted nucleotide-binding protein